jgi:hypothetical protein
MAKSPNLLVLTWLHWPSAARISAALSAAGARVDVLCSDFHPIRSVAGLGRLHRYDMLAPARSLARAIERSDPQHIIVTDDIALAHVQALRSCGGQLSSLIESSLGPAQSYDIVASRDRFAAAARRAGLAIPACAPVSGEGELRAWLDAHGAPAFLKIDGTFGGEGVRLVRQAGEAAAVFRDLGRVPSFADACDQAARLRVFSKASAWLRRTAPALSVHEAIAGQPANCCAFAWRGVVEHVVSVVTLETLRPFGVATVVRAVENPRMREAAATIARALDLTGFFGLDFILDADGRAWVLELNARPTPISHLALGPGRDLVAALLSALAGQRRTERPVAFAPDAPIALFPHLLDRSEREPHEQDDVPLDQPALVRALRLRRRSFAAMRDFAGRGGRDDAAAPPRAPQDAMAASRVETPLS